MTWPKLPSGFAVLCDAAGAVRQVIRDESSLFGADAVGRDLLDWVDEGSRDKARLFLTELRAQRAAFGWELNVPLQGALAPLHFAGGLTADGLLIIGARSRNGVARLFEELMLINNEQMNSLRAVFKEQSLQARTEGERDGALYDELTRLNNDLANAQRKLAKQNAELEKLNQEKNRLLGMAAHDLRSPLGVILGYIQFLAADAADVLTPEQFEFLSVIQNRTDFMLHLIDDLLDVSRIESGRLELSLETLDWTQLTERNVHLNRVLAARKQIDLTFSVERGLPSVWADGPKLEQVLNNLISNALKFSLPNTQVEVRLARSGMEIVLFVRDHGPGIPAAELGGLFKPFQRTSVRATSGEKSTGLGLAIARKIVEGHHGRIWVESEVGVGSTFYVALPVSR